MSMTPDQVTEDYVPLREAAGIVGIDRSSLYRAVQRGRMPHYDVSGRVFLARSDVARFAEARAVMHGSLMQEAAAT